MVDRTSSQLLEKCPILLGVLARRKVDTVFATHFLFAKSKHRAKGRIDEERPSFQVLQRNPDGTRFERIVEELAVGSHRLFFLLLNIRRLMALVLSQLEGNRSEQRPTTLGLIKHSATTRLESSRGRAAVASKRNSVPGRRNCLLSIRRYILNKCQTTLH